MDCSTLELTCQDVQEPPAPCLFVGGTLGIYLEGWLWLGLPPSLVGMLPTQVLTLELSLALCYLSMLWAVLQGYCL